MSDDRKEAALRERRAWAELYHSYDRCVVIAESVWDERLNEAQEAQQVVAERMRDRTIDPIDRSVFPGTTTFLSDPREASIHVPLFTPRDRLQFIKEVATTLFIEAGTRNRNLTASYKEPQPDAKTQQADEAGPVVEAASGADETDATAPLTHHEAYYYGEPVSKAPAPGISAIHPRPSVHPRRALHEGSIHDLRPVDAQRVPACLLGPD